MRAAAGQALQSSLRSRLQLAQLLAVCVALALCSHLSAQQPGSSSSQTPDAPGATPSSSTTLQPRTAAAPARVVMVNYRPYKPPTQHDLFHDYWHDTYGLNGLASTSARALYAQGLDHPSGWGQDWPGFGQRFGSSAAVTAINGNVRYGMEELFHEDLRYIPCHGCGVKHKIENALLAEITARHQNTGRRFFTLTPTVSDFSGPIIVHTAWYPGHSGNPLDGVVSARLVFATRIGSHLFREFVLERRHKDAPEQ
jgi:hypothetical protein